MELTIENLITAGLADVAGHRRARLSSRSLMPGFAGRWSEPSSALNDFGVGRGDRVALVLADGPEMATAFLGVAAGATAAPLNPAYRAEEFEFYLTDLKARALIVDQGSQSPAREVASRLGISILELVPQPELGAGRSISLRPRPRSGGLAPGASQRPRTSRSCSTLRGRPRGRSWSP